MSKLIGNKMRQLAIAVAAVAASAGLALTFVAPAQAATTTDHMVVQAARIPALVASPAGEALSCVRSDALCLYVDAGFRSDSIGFLTGSNADLRALSHGSCASDTWNDCISSLDNETSTGMTMFKNINGKGDSRCLPSGMSISNLATAKYTSVAKSIMNDSISSNLRGPCPA